MSILFSNDTIVASATPELKSALAIVRISGNDAIRFTSKLLREPEVLWSARSSTSIYSSIVDQAGIEVDDVIVNVYRAPRSFTGEELVEITCHGSPLISNQILDLLRLSGARMAESGEFSRRAFLHGKITLEDSEIIHARIASESNGQLRGAQLAIHQKYDRFREVYQGILECLALVNAQIDFGESDDIQISGLAEHVERVQAMIGTLLSLNETRKLNSGYFTIAFIGPPNVGKSSLFNKLLEFERSIVSEVPGTTRDYLEAFIRVGDHKIKIIDTAGLRETSEAIEARGIELGRSANDLADLSILLTDPSTRHQLPQSADLVVHNKRDLDGWADGLTISAKTGAGVANLLSAIATCLLEFESGRSGLEISTSERSTLERALNWIKSASTVKELPLLAEDLRSAAQDVAILLGLNISEDTLNHIFLKMCIGK
jgi:tRNA modification GTPase